VWRISRGHYSFIIEQANEKEKRIAIYFALLLNFVKTKDMNEELKQAVERAAEEHSIRKDNEAEAQDGFIAGAEFMFSLLSKPSERPNIKEYLGDSAGLKDVHEQIIAAPRLYAYMNALDAYIDNLEAKLI
jgi:hypothetical protein